MASKKNARRNPEAGIVHKLEKVRQNLGLTVDQLYWRAGREHAVPPRTTANQIAEYYLAVQGEGEIDPPSEVRALINKTLKSMKAGNVLRRPRPTQATSSGFDAVYG